MSWARHNVCLTCYDKQYPGRQPVLLKPEYCQEERCCWCGKLTQDGCYVRGNDPPFCSCRKAAAVKEEARQ